MASFSNGFVCLIALVCLLACTNESAVSTAGQKVYRHSMQGEANSLDPVHASSVYNGFIVTNIYDTLYRFKYLARPFELTPNLAESLPEVSSDGLRYRIRLQPNVYFSPDASFVNGEKREVIADDVVYSLKRHFDPKTKPRGAWLWRNKIVGLDAWKDAGSDYDTTVQGLIALDRYTVQVILTAPFPQFPLTLAGPHSAVVAREVVEYYGREFAHKPVGSGPFVLDQINSIKASLLKSPTYRHEVIDIYDEGFDAQRHGFSGVESIHNRVAPLLDRLQVDFYNEDAVRWQSFLKGGESQYAWIPAGFIDAALESDNPIQLRPEFAERYFVSSNYEVGFIHQDFNMADPMIGYHTDPTQNKANWALRCALIKAFDWSARVEQIFKNNGRAFPGVIPPILEEFDPHLSHESIAYDLDAAKALLSDHGWTAQSLPTLSYAIENSSAAQLSFRQFRQFATELGFPFEKIKGKSFPNFGEYSRAIKTRQVSTFPLSWTLDYVDASNVLQLYYGPNEAPGVNNANYNNPQFDRLYERAITMKKSQERTDIYRQLNQMVIDDCVSISGFSRRQIHLWHKNVVMIPDKDTLVGQHMRFVDVKPN